MKLRIMSVCLMIAETPHREKKPYGKKAASQSPEDELEQTMQELEAKLAALGDSTAQDTNLTADDVSGALIEGMLSGLEKMADDDEGFSFDFEIRDVVLDAKLGAAFWAGDDTRMQAVAVENVDAADTGVSDDTRTPEEIAWAETAEKLTFIGIDPAVMGEFEDVIPDRYGDIKAGKPGAVDAFVASGQDPNTETGYDQITALLAALDAPGRNANDIGKLITAGADATYIHRGCDSVFSYMVYYSHPDTVNADSELAIAKLLSTHGADIHHTAPMFGSALQCAVTRAKPDFIKALLDVGADANQLASEDVQFDFLAGASMLALAGPRPDVVHLLLANGADPNSLDGYDGLATDFIADQIEAFHDERLSDDWTKVLVEKLQESQSVIEGAAEK